MELTEQAIGERRLHVLRDVADRTADGRSVEEAARILAQTFENSTLDLPFVLLYLVDADGLDARLVETTGLPKGDPAAPLRVDLRHTSSRGWPLREAALSHRAVEVNDVLQRVGHYNCSPYPEPPRSAFVIPISVPGQQLPLALVVAGVSARRPLNEAYRMFYQMLGLAVTNIFAKAHAWQEERKRVEALAELDRVKTAFFSNVSHEFRTPLTLLLGPLEEELRENPATRPRLELAHRNALRLLKLVNTLLDFSRLEAGRMQAAYQPLDISAFTAELASVFRSAIEKAGLRLVVDCPPLADPLYVDREMWEKIVLNLLSNALKFTFEGEIRVAIRAAGERVELIVSDTGTGIPAAELPRIFERFHRVREARSRSHEGTGIGLALVSELVSLHGGEVTAQSAGGGTTFIVAIPTGASHLPGENIVAPRNLPSGAASFVEEVLHWLPESGLETHSLPESAEDSETHSRKKFRVLLADDNSDMRGYVRRLLGERYQVLAVADGEEALTALHRDTFDLVVTDVMMPHLDGFGLLHAVRSDPVLKATPVILLSARAGEESRVEGLDAGADDYLVKPFSAGELLARVGSALNLARLRREAEVETRKSEARLAAANRDLNEFATVVSHDLKAPLRGVSTLANWLQSDYADKLDQEGRENLVEMVRRVARMDRMIDGILRYSRAGRQEEIALPVSLSELVPDVVEDLVPRDRAKQVRVDIAAALPVVPGDPVRLRQVFQNLISNAIKFSDKPELQIKIGCEKLGDSWEFTVSDNGPGIEERHFERIFKLFETLSPKDRTDSTGVGLAVVKRIVEGADGKVRVHSALGQGSSFSFTWPCSLGGSTALADSLPVTRGAS